MRRRLGILRDEARQLGGGASLRPLFALAALNLVDELDTAAFGALAPEIRSTFGLSDAGFTAIASLASALALACSLPIGHLGDRGDRVRLAQLAAVVWSTAALAAAAAGHVVVLVLARLVNGIGRTTNLPVHSSLLADWYPRRAIGPVLSVYTSANYVAAAAAPLVGFLGAVFGWRTAVALTAVPTIVVLLVTRRLEEPLRGAQDDAGHAAEEADVARRHPATFAESRRRIFAVPTLRRLLVVAYVVGLCVFPLGTFLSFHFEQTFGAGPTVRGVVQLAVGLGAGAGLAAGAVALQRSTRRRGAVAAADTMTLGIVIYAVGVLAVALAPGVVPALLAVAVVGASSGCFYPALQSLVAVVAPPTARAQAYAWVLVVAAGGGLSAFTISGIGEELGYRVGLAVLAALAAVGAAVATTLRRLIPGDEVSAARALAAMSEARGEAEDTSAILFVRDLDVDFDGQPVLRGVGLSLRPGEVLALLGTNGAGKSTALDAVLGHVSPTRGTILVDGRDVTFADQRQLARMGVAHVPGGKSTLPGLTVAEHLRLAAWLLRHDRTEVAARIDAALQRLPAVRPLLEVSAAELSGGEQHLVALAAALVQRPRVLLVDELGLGLAPAAVDDVCALLGELRDGGCSIVVVDQSASLCSRVADRAVFLERGEVRFDGPIAELTARDDLLRAVFLGGDADAADSPGRPTTAPAALPRLRLAGVGCSLGGRPVLRDVELAVAAGATTAVVGPNGAGKTTLLDVVSGFVTPTAGRIELAGRDITALRPEQRAAGGLGRTLQDGRLAPTLTVLENIALGFDRSLAFPSLAGAVLGLAPVRWEEADVRFRAADLAAALGLGAWADHPVHHLSTGTRRLVNLAVAVAHQPRVLLLDEPSAGLAKVEVPALAEMLRRAIELLGCATVLVEHDLELVGWLADEVVTLEDGVLTGAVESCGAAQVDR